MAEHSIRRGRGRATDHLGRSGFWSMPTSRAGRSSLWSAALFWLFLAVFYGLVAADIGDPGALRAAWPLWLSLSAAGTCGVCAALTGLAALLGTSDRSVMVFLSTLLGLLVTIFLSGEVLFMH